MAEHTKKQSGAGIFLLGVLCLALIAIAVTVPAPYMERVYMAERSAVQTLLGEAEQEVYEASYVAPSEDMRVGLADLSRDLGRHKPLTEWTSSRVVVTWLWGNLISYRLVMLFAWLLSFLPFIVAAFIDGYYVREARKYSFFSQSPIRHKVGVRTAISVCGMAAVSVVMPLAIPPVVAPIALLAIGSAGWLWTSNLQKRL